MAACWMYPVWRLIAELNRETRRPSGGDVCVAMTDSPLGDPSSVCALGGGWINRRLIRHCGLLDVPGLAFDCRIESRKRLGRQAATLASP